MGYNETHTLNLKEETMTLNILKSRRERAAQIRLEQVQLEEHYRMMELISIASKNGMK
jgi:hypothetical protein